MSRSAGKSTSAWGIGMFALYGGFVAFILALVLFVSLQDIQMVESNYYEKELAYQDRIDRMNRVNTLSDRVAIGYDPATRLIDIVFPAEVKPSSVNGSIHAYRPSNARLDFTQAITCDSTGRQAIDASNMVPGVWRLRIEWNGNDLKFFSEEMIYIQ